MDFWHGLVYPDLVITMMDLLDGVGGATAHPSIPSNFQPDTDKVIVVVSAGGSEDVDGSTLNGIIQIQCYAPNYVAASQLAQSVQWRVEACPGTEIGTPKTLVDEADLWSAPMEIPDDYPDDRRITTHYRLAVRRQVQPA